MHRRKGTIEEANTTTAGRYRILESLDDPSTYECIALLLRHSERSSLKGLSEEERKEVGLTPNGVEMARGLGKTLGERLPLYPLSLYHSPIRRCMLTSEYIREGYSMDNISMVTEPSLGSPVVDVTEYYRLRENTHWIGFNREWVTGRLPSNVITPPELYARGVLEAIKRFIAREGLGVFVAHDNTIFPIVNHFFGAESVGPVGYLEGLAISRNHDTVRVSYMRDEKSMKLEDM